MEIYLLLIILIAMVSVIGFNFNNVEKAYIRKRSKRMIKKLRRKSDKWNKKH